MSETIRLSGVRETSTGKALVQRLRAPLARGTLYVLLIALAAVSLFPLYWLFNTALTPASSTAKLPPDLIPANPTLENLVEIFKASGQGKLSIPFTDIVVPMSRLPLWFINTAFIAILSTAIHVLFDSMAGYAFAKLRFRGKSKRLSR